jgi:ribosomal protein S19
MFFSFDFKLIHFICIKKVFVTWSRSSTIIPSMLGHTIAVYNGREHIVLLISDQMIGHMSFY